MLVMLLLLLSYLAGVLTIISPCILPVLPFVFARAGQPFMRSGLPLLLGMAVTFAGVATLAAVGGGWAVQANSFGRAVALLILGLFGLLLLFPALADRATRPLVKLGARLTEATGPERSGGSFWASLLLGFATGLLWAPCAGPILGLILTGAALQGANVGTSLLLLAYAAGAATSLALALLLGGRVFAAMKRSIRVGDWFRRSLGALVLVAVAAIALGLDTGLLTRLSLAGTSAVEQRLLDKFRLDDRSAQTSMPGDGPLGIEGALPPLTGATSWLNSPSLTREALRGKVVLVDFWTYSCINCLRTLPYVKAWEQKYRAAGFVVIGVHAPEFAFEKDPSNVAKAVRDLGITYPVALDNNHASGAPSTTAIGQRITSSMAAAAFDTIISAKAITPNPRRSSSGSSPRMARRSATCEPYRCARRDPPRRRAGTMYAHPRPTWAMCVASVSRHRAASRAKPCMTMSRRLGCL
jgi:cytochrome c biogenesis protein CcdA/thiol-disulfide isomerase/thioredoxin